MKDLSYYMSLPYTIQIKEMNDESGRYFFATVAELHGCMSDGETLAEAYENIRESMEAWISNKLKHGEDVPEPVDDGYSGKLNVRMPKSLHRHLVMEAKREGVSLNQLILYKLSR